MKLQSPAMKCNAHADLTKEDFICTEVYLNERSFYLAKWRMVGYILAEKPAVSCPLELIQFEEIPIL